MLSQKRNLFKIAKSAQCNGSSTKKKNEKRVGNEFQDEIDEMKRIEEEVNRSNISLYLLEFTLLFSWDKQL